MKLLHTLSIDADHFVLVFDNNSPSNYNRFISVVPKNNKKDFLAGHTMKTSTKKEYKAEGLRDLKSYIYSLNKEKENKQANHRTSFQFGL